MRQGDIPVPVDATVSNPACKQNHPTLRHQLAVFRRSHIAINQCSVLMVLRQDTNADFH
jgi:hypothetical protein